MTRFTDSPYEYLMTQKPYAGRERDSGPVPLWEREALHRRVHEKTAFPIKEKQGRRRKTWEKRINRRF